MITVQDIELLAALLQRAGVNPYEAAWANGIMDEIRAMVAKAELERKKEAEAE